MAPCTEIMKIIQKELCHIVESAQTTPLFNDREDAGNKLLGLIGKGDYTNPVLIGVVNGGIPVSIGIKNAWGIPLYVCHAAKIPLSDDRRFGIGAIVDGHMLFNKDLLNFFGLRESEYHEGVIESAYSQLRSSIDELGQYTIRPQDLKDKEAIVVDDGMATGYTALAVATYLRAFNPKRLVIATPIASEYACDLLRSNGLECIACHQISGPEILIDNFYRSFPQLSSSQVRIMLEQEASI